MNFRYKVILWVFIGALMPATVFSQDNYEIKGKVVDADTEEAIPYAMVFLVNKTSGLNETGNSTDDKGVFELQTNATNVRLVIRFLGYEDYVLESLPGYAGVVDLGVIKMEESATAMDGVVVVGERSKMEFKLDKRVFHVGKDIASTGVGALDVLNNVPSVNVDIEGNVTLRGNSGVQILIDGKPSAVSDDPLNALGTVTADMIESIEVITNPSAKYEAGGTSGILNIVLKKEEKTGVNGSVSVNTGYPNNHSVGGSLNYRTQKFNLFTQFGGGLRSYPGYAETENVNLLNGSKIWSDGESQKNEQFYNITLGADYFINHYNTITLSGNLAYEFENAPSDTRFRLYDSTGALVTKYAREGLTTATNPKYQYDLQYKRQFKNNEDHVLLFSTQGRFFGKDQESEFKNNYTLGNDGAHNQLTATDFYQATYTYKLDYTNPLNDNITIELGSMYEINDVGNDYAVFDQNADDWVPNISLTNDFNYNQKVLGVYGTGAYEKDKWGVKLGLRLEQTDLTTVLENTNERNNQNYTNLFPSVHTSYKFNQRFSIQAGYSRRIFRPHLWDLNPFFNIQNNYRIRTGNPALRPEFGDSYELSAIYMHNKWTLNASIYQLYTTDVTERISYYEQGVNISRPENIGTNRKTGLEVNGKYTPLKWLSLNGDFNYGYFNRLGSFEGTDFNFSSDQCSGKLTAKLDLPYDIDFEITPQYRSGYKTVQGDRTGFFFANAGLRKKLLKNKAVVSLGVRDLFASRIMETTVDQADFYLRSYYKRGRFLSVGFSYSFGKGEVMTYTGRRR